MKEGEEEEEEEGRGNGEMKGEERKCEEKTDRIQPIFHLNAAKWRDEKGGELSRHALSLIFCECARHSQADPTMIL